jgi:hypothetical protein
LAVVGDVRQASENFSCPTGRARASGLGASEVPRLEKNINYFTDQPFGYQVQTKQEHLQAKTIAR